MVSSLSHSSQFNCRWVLGGCFWTSFVATKPTAAHRLSATSSSHVTLWALAASRWPAGLQACVTGADYQTAPRSWLAEPEEVPAVFLCLLALKGSLDFSLIQECKMICFQGASADVLLLHIRAIPLFYLSRLSDEPGYCFRVIVELLYTKWEG